MSASEDPADEQDAGTSGGGRRLGQDTREGLVSPEMLTDDRRLSAEDPGVASPEALRGAPPRGQVPPRRSEDMVGDVPAETEAARDRAPGQELSAGEG